MGEREEASHCLEAAEAAEVVLCIVWRAQNVPNCAEISFGDFRSFRFSETFSFSPTGLTGGGMKKGKKRTMIEQKITSRIC